MTRPRGGDPCPQCGDTLGGLATKCYGGPYGNGCGWTLAEWKGEPGGALESRRSPLPDTRSEKDIEAGIIATLRTVSFTVWKISQPRATMQTPGIPDLFVTGHGVATWGEIKRADGEQSAEQRTFQLAVEAAGYSYEIWRSEDDAMEWALAVMGRAA